MSEKLVVTMSYEEVYRATNGFSQDNVVGTGDTGTTYKAALPDGLLLAVKRFHVSNCAQDRFESELMTLGRLSHCNVVLKNLKKHMKNLKTKYGGTPQFIL